MLAGHCWKTFQANNKNHTNNLKDLGIKFVRIFLDCAYLPKGVLVTDTQQKWQAYVDNLVKTMPDGMTKWTYEDFPMPFWSANPNDTFKDNLDLCKRLNWLPIICAGYREEPIETYTWINRSPDGGQVAWLKRFAQELAIYLKSVYGFIRADLEIWNEYNEAMSVSKYISLATDMCMAWKTTVPEYKTHIFGCDIKLQEYLDPLLQNETLLKYVDYISPHILTFSEWDDPAYKATDYIKQEEWGNSTLLEVTYNKVKAIGKKISLLEISPLDNMARLNRIIGKCDMYALVLAIRNSNIGTAFDITDLLVYDFDNPNKFIAIATDKMRWLKDFNNKYANEILPEGNDMQLEKFYYRLKTTFNRDPNKVGVRFIQSALGLVTDGNFGLKTEGAVKAYQISKDFDDDGIVGPETFTALIDEFPRLYDEMDYKSRAGIW